jgi:hypothetical protein
VIPAEASRRGRRTAGEVGEAHSARRPSGSPVSLLSPVKPKVRPRLLRPFVCHEGSVLDEDGNWVTVLIKAYKVTMKSSFTVH